LITLITLLLLTANRSQRIEKPCYSIVAWTQADVLCNILDQSRLATGANGQIQNDGLVPRLLCLCPEAEFKEYDDYITPTKKIPSTSMVLSVSKILHMIRPLATYRAETAADLQLFKTKYNVIKRRIKAIHLVDVWEGGELSKVISYYARFALSFAAIDYIFFLIEKFELYIDRYPTEKTPPIHVLVEILNQSGQPSQ